MSLNKRAPLSRIEMQICLEYSAKIGENNAAIQGHAIQRIRDFLTMRYINSLLLTYLHARPVVI